jgi:dTMP kinase
MTGLFVTFEGGEGTGKTTQLKALLAALRSIGRDALETRDPGGTTIGNQVRDLLLDRENVRMTALTELLLYEASRAQLVHEIIRPALAGGMIVLCDRFTDSTVAYQGYGRGLDLSVVARLNALGSAGLAPDLTLLFDLDPATGLARAAERLHASRKTAGDRIEAEVLAFHQRVRMGYRALAAAEPDRFVVLDAGRGILEIGAEVRRRVDARLAGAPPAQPGTG